MKSLSILILLLCSMAFGNSATLRTIQYDPTTSNTVPTNLNIRARSLTLGSPDSPAGYQILYGTNGVGDVTKVASSNSVSITNIVGLLHKASAATIILDCNDGNEFQITNQLGQGTILIITNLAQGQQILIGADADGTSRSLTIIPHLGFLARDLDAFGIAPAASKAITLTNGNSVEICIRAKWSNSTNFADIVTRQAKY